MFASNGGRQHRWIETDHGRLRVRVVGEGPPILFVHGLLCDSLVWDPVVDRLAADHTCVLVDWPMGSHTVPMTNGVMSPRRIAGMVPQVLQELGLREVTLVANDGGGIIAQLVLAAAPQEVAGYVITPCDTAGNCPPPLFRWMCWLARIPGGLWILAQMSGFDPALRLPLTYGRLSETRLDGELLARWVRPLRQKGIRSDLEGFLLTVEHTDLGGESAALARNTQPVLLLWSRHNRVFPLRRGRELCATVRGAEIRVLDHGQTYLSLDAPDWLADNIREFVSTRVGHDRGTSDVTAAR